MTRPCRCAPQNRCGKCPDATIDGRPYTRPKCRVLTDSDCDCAMCELTRLTEECGTHLTDSQAAQLIPVWPDCDQGEMDYGGEG